MADINELKAQYKALAKKADRQLRALEALSTKEHYKGVLKYAYARAERDIKVFDKGQQYKNPRFSRNIPEDTRSLQARINDVQEFLESKTNTKKNITDVYRQRAKTVNEKYGTNFTWQDLANYYESDVAEINASQYGSDSIVRVLGLFKRKGLTPEKIQEKIKQHERLSDDDVLNEIAYKVAQDGLTIDALFGGN